MAVPKLGTADYELQMFSRNQAELRQFWRLMRRLLAGLVLLATALSLAAQNLPGVPAGKLAPHSEREISSRKSKHFRL